MTPAIKTVGLLLASGTLVATSLFLTQAPSQVSAVEPTPETTGPTGPARFLTALPESTHILRGAGETHIAVSIKAPDVADRASRPPLSVAIVLDRSGSMSGDKLEQAKRAATELIRKLDARDHFSVTTYGTDVKTILHLQRAEPHAVEQATQRIAGIQVRGGTNIGGGLTAGATELARDDDSVRRIVLISDGQATTGIVGQEELAALAGRSAAKGISTTTVGIGLDFDEKKMTAIAVAGRGNYYFAENATNLSALFSTELGRVTATAATDIAVSINPASGVEVLGAYGHTLDGRTAKLADLYAGETRRVVFRVKARARANGNLPLAKIRLAMTAVESGERVDEAADVAVTVTDDHHAVTRGQHADAVTMIERARTAMTLEQATTLYERGDAAGARRVMSVRRQEAKAKAAEIGSAELADELDGIASDAEASFAPAPASKGGKSGRKRNRAKSYDLLY